MQLNIIDSGQKSAAANMEYDQHLLLSLKPTCNPILHFYDWQAPSATYGYFSNPLLQMNTIAVQKFNLELAKRPTGGGIIFHQFDFAFSFLLPASHPQFSLNTLDNYLLVNTIIAKAIDELLQQRTDKNGVSANLNSLELQPSATNFSDDTATQRQLKNFCMALPTVYDVVSGDFKLAGGAQRKTKAGFLHQASIALMLPPDDFLDEILGEHSIIAKAMKKHSFGLLEMDASQMEQQTTKAFLKNLLIKFFQERLITEKSAHSTC